MVEQAAPLGGYAITFSGIGYGAADRMGILPALAEPANTQEEMTYVEPDGTTASLPSD